MTTESMLIAILAAPLVSAGLIALLARRAATVCSILSVGAAGVSMVLTLMLLYGGELGGGVQFAVPWMTMGALEVSLGFYLNDLSAAMLFVVTFVGFWIHVFSLGYMHDDPGKGRYFGGLSIFMFSMLGIVLADNLFMIFIFWELVGYSSYMLIGHYFDKPSAAAASKKAFIVNRIGDFGFLIGIIWCFWQFGSVNLVDLETAANYGLNLPKTLIGLCLICGMIGKSAQLPLHVWLPDAMEGPTPVSALIHAATMVAAGVYFLCRVHFLFTAEVLNVVLWIGTVTAAFAAFCALAQRDIKRILAYSTLSQLGFMVAAFGAGTLYGRAVGDGHALLYGVGAAMFHLTTHAFFKALLFLGSGSVIHSLHHEQDIFRMGGLLKRMPVTSITFLIGVIAISGLPFLGAGFYSKDAILYIVHNNGRGAFIVLTITALLTALYMGRLYIIAFLGKPKSEQAEKARESSWVMWLPLVVLAVYSFLGGSDKLLGWIDLGLMDLLYSANLGAILYDAVPHPHGDEQMLFVAISAACSIFGLLIAVLFYRIGAEKDRLDELSHATFEFLRGRLYFDELYDWYVSEVQRRVADFVDLVDQLLIGTVIVRLGFAGSTGVFGLLARAVHVGSIHAYVYWFLAGVVLFGLFAAGVF